MERLRGQAIGLSHLIPILLCAGLAWAQPAATVVPVTGGVNLDGRLDEAFWQQAEVVELSQQAPKPGEATPFRTTVRVAVTGDAIYFGFVCEDPSPGQIAIHTMQRDGNLEGDDFVSVALDTYGDRRTGYFFRINAAGARVDGLIAGVESPSLDWDGIWDARTNRTERGWSAELMIPSRTLNFTPGLTEWGANFERNIARVRTVMRWTSPTLDSFFFDLSRGGTLKGLQELRQGLGIEVSPYYVARRRDFIQQGDGNLQGAPGGDFTYRITSQMAAVFTVNTDFAETEVDTRQLNVTRFPLFFPERRGFFLEGSNQYQFGLGMEDYFIPFFSRRMGLFQGGQIPINAGLKLNGRAGRWNVGLLDVQTRDTVLPNGRAVPGTNLFASRISYDVTPKLRLGTILTNGNPDGVHNNRLAGFDGVWRTSEMFGNKNFFVGGWTAISSSETTTGNRTGYGFKVDYPNDRWDCSASFNKFGEGLDASLGFLPRPGIERWDLGCDFKPRPRKDGPFGWIRQQFTEHRFYRVTNYRGQVESQRFRWAPINVQMESGDRFEFNWLPWYEFLPVPFEIADNVVLPVGEYRFDRFRAEFETSPHRVAQFGNTTWFGTFYNGTLLQQINYARYTDRRGRYQVGLNLEQNFGRLQQGSFVQRLWQLNTTYSFSPNLVWTSFLQYDTESQNVGNNMRLRWTVKPGNDLFVVWNRGWKRLYLSRDDLTLLPETDLIAVKLRWTFRW